MYQRSQGAYSSLWGLIIPISVVFYFVFLFGRGMPWAQFFGLK